MSKKKFKGLKFGLLGIAIIVLLGLFGFVIKWLWNGVMPNVFGLNEITYWQGIGLFIISRIFIGGFGSDSKNNTVTYHKKSKKEENAEPVEINISSPVKVEKASDAADELFDEWWAKEGEQSFDAFLEKEDSDE
jgi:hypothetical protein